MSLITETRTDQDTNHTETTSSAPLIDRFGRHVTYIRISVTDRCDFRCVYCMAEDMEFVPRAQLLTLEELAFV
jgi:GTP 3',8-cyclase